MAATLSDLPTLDVIGERYLDTQHDAAYIASLEAELKRRGNMFWWEWASLGERDVRAGWISNLVLFALAAAVAAFYGGLTAAVVAVFALHALTLWIGLELRRGSVEAPGET